jgi:alcohol dehydrogenase (cytochrome c)
MMQHQEGVSGTAIGLRFATLAVSPSASGRAADGGRGHLLDRFSMQRTILILLCLLVSTAPQVWPQNPSSGDWPAYARDFGSTGYSRLLEIQPENVSKLHQICAYSLPEQATFESSLVVLNGTMYFTTSEYTYALDASTCNLRWRVRRQLQNPGRTVRGVAISGNRLYREFSGGYVVAYDLGSGDQVWATRLKETDGWRRIGLDLL